MISLSRRAFGASAVALLAGCATKTAATTTPVAPVVPPHPPAKLGSFGVDLSSLDTSVKPGDDFFRFANGSWIKNTTIPADRTRWGSFDILRDQAEKDVRALIETVAAGGGAPGSKPQKIADFYNSYIGVDAINAAGLAPAQADLALIAAARTHEDVIRLIGMPGMPVNSPIALYVTLDEKNPDRYVVGMSHAGLSLPDREYYLKDDPDLAGIRREFTAHVERMLTLANQPNAARKARAIAALETEIARRHWPIEERRERDKTYNLLTRAQIRALDARFPWDAAFESCGMGDVQEVVVSELSAIGPLAQLFRATPVATWRDYLTYHYLSNTADVLPHTFDDENFAFYGHTLNGQPQQRERWKRGVDAVNGALGEAIGELYVAQHFPPESKAQMLALVENLRRSYGARIDALSWMSAETKAAAHQKLATFRPKIGYPNKWRDYDGLDVHANDAFGNAKRLSVYDWNYDLARLSRPADKDEWFITPQTVNAYYNPVFNEVVFPAAILQPPFFDPNADAAVNYGAIGGVIGHEMGHGFDDQGAKSDAQGVLRDWWTPADLTAFHQRTQALVNQYNGFVALPDLHVNGQLTLGENIGDNGGLQAAYYAYKISLGGAEAPVIDGYTGDQRFFLGWAQVWQAVIRDQRLRTLVMSDPHSPSSFRCNGVVRNMSAWYAAFNVQPTDALYLPPDQRVEIW
jgi:putative endopeptidase